VSVDRVLSQEEIDNVFKKLRETAADDDPAKKAQVYDFRRPDRIAKDQLRAIHLLHENFARALASSLSAYLRAYVAVNLVSVEQLSFMEFTQCLPSPTCMIALGMRPFDGNAVLEINPTLVFPILEMLLGGSGKIATKINREITEIEQNIMEGLLRIVLHDLRTAWHAVTTIDFAIENFETEPQLLQILAPNEAVVAISMEVRIGDTAGMMNIGIPSIIIKMLRQKFDQQWSVRKTRATEEERGRVLRLIRPAIMNLDARLQGPKMGVETLLDLKEGDVLAFDYPIERPLDITVNGKLKYSGEVVSTGRKRAFQIHQLVLDETLKVAAGTT
jgi:flagellar motor switch protein FliM